jgi:vacuolar-type H+-ATPase subunit E/Vma4
MSLEAILARIESDAEKEAEEILRAADREKKEVLRRAGARLEELQAKDMKKLKLEMEDLERRMKEHTRREADKKLQNRRRTLIDGAIDHAVKTLAFCDDEIYLKLLGSIIASCDAQGRIEVVAAVGENRITPDFLKNCSGEKREFVLSSRRHDEEGGVILVSGKISYNGTFSMFAELAHEEMVMRLSPLAPLR